MKPLNGRLETLAQIAAAGSVEITYGGVGFVLPNKWVSSAIIHDFESQGLIERQGNQAVITEKGSRLLKETSKWDTQKMQ